jgi:hypothetical protein
VSTDSKRDVPKFTTTFCSKMKNVSAYRSIGRRR